jgi:hypothetical protein
MTPARRTVFVAAAVALLAAPPAFGAQARLYRIAMSGRDTAAVTRSRAVSPPEEWCQGTVTETRHFTSAFGVVPAPDRAFPIDRYSNMHFKARLTHPRYFFRLDTSGAWTVDPSFDDPPPDPSTCAFAHEHTNLSCRFVPWAPSTLVSRFFINPGMTGRYTVHYNRINALPLTCARNDGLQLLDSSERTRLTERAVKRLAPGRRVSASGTLVTSYDYDVNDPAIDEHQRGQERFKYTLTVRRVR